MTYDVVAKRIGLMYAIVWSTGLL